MGLSLKSDPISQGTKSRSCLSFAIFFADFAVRSGLLWRVAPGSASTARASAVAKRYGRTSRGLQTWSAGALARGLGASIKTESALAFQRECGAVDAVVALPRERKIQPAENSEHAGIVRVHLRPQPAQSARTGATDEQSQQCRTHALVPSVFGHDKSEFSGISGRIEAVATDGT